MPDESPNLTPAESATPEAAPTESAEAAQVCLLPGHLFFTESVEVPDALEAAEIQDFAELSLESIAPFPIEQLYWGYLHAEDAPSMLIYAAHRDRLKNSGFTELDSFVWVLPDFATLAGAIFPEATEVTFECGNSISMLQYDRGQAVPMSVVSGVFEPEDPAAAIRQLQALLPRNEPSTRTIHIRHSTSNLSDNGEATFHHEPVDRSSDAGYGKWTPLALPQAKLWQADVRSAAFKQAERRARRTSARLTQLTGWALVAALVLVGAEAVLLLGQLWESSLVSQVEAQRTAVARIEDRQSLMNKLEQVAQNELRPIDVLSAANDMRLDLGLRTIEYDEVTIEGENLVTIEGKAGTVNELNRYTEQLHRSGQFELVGQPEYLTRGGETTFTVTLNYLGNQTSPETPEATSVPQAAEAGEDGEVAL